MLYIGQIGPWQLSKKPDVGNVLFVAIAKSSKVMPAVILGAQSALSAYRFEVESSDMTYAAKETYLLHAEQFVRWMEGDFKPGNRLN